MSNSPPKTQDYKGASVTARYGYYASVLHPGMTPADIKAAIQAIQKTSSGLFNQPFVAYLSDVEINDFIQNWEIVGSSAGNAEAARTGLDVVVLRSRTNQELAVSIGGVGPYDIDLVEGGKLVYTSATYGFDIGEYNALKSIFDPIRAQYSTDSIDIYGHSKGGQLSTVLYADLSLQGLGAQINGVFEFAPVGIDIRSHTSEAYYETVVEWAGSVFDPALFAQAGQYINFLENNNLDKIISFTAEGDPLAGDYSLTYFMNRAKVYGTAYLLHNDAVGKSRYQYAHSINTIGDLMLKPFNNTVPLANSTAPLILGGVRIDTSGDIVVTGQRIKVRSSTNKSPVRVVDPKTGVLLPSHLRLRNDGDPGSANSVVDRETGRAVEYDTTEIDGVRVVTRQTIYDEVDAQGQPKLAIIQGLDEKGNITSSDIKVAGSLIGFSDLGGLLGQQLGYRIAGDNKIAGVVTSALLKTLGDNLGDILDGALNGESIGGSIRDAFAATGSEFVQNLEAAGIGAVSSFLTAELVGALGIDGFAGELANSVGGAAINQIITNLGTMAAGGPGAAGVTVFSNVGPAVVTAAASFLGTKLANQIHTFDSVGGQIGSAVGAGVAAFIDGPMLADALAFSAATGQWEVLAIAVVIAVIDIVVVDLIGGLIGSIFGGTPRSGADSQWDPAQQKFVVANSYARKGGSEDTARGLASAVSDTFNAIVSATGGTLLNPEAVQSGNYGMRKKEFVYRPYSTQDKDAITQTFTGKNAAQQLVGYGIYQGLTDPDFQIAGGDIYAKRALYNTFSIGGLDPRNFDTNVLFGNLSATQQYESYLANASVINALVAAEPDTVFAAETLLTLTRADELGLTRRAASDWFGGYSFLLGESKTNAATVGFGFDYDSASGQVSRLISVGDYILGDTIDIAGQTTIGGTAASDSIDLRNGKLANQIGFTVNDHVNSDIALSGTDFTAQAGIVLNFAAGDLRKSIGVAVAADGVAEATEKFLGKLSNGTGVSIVGGAAEATIIDGTAAKPTLVVGRSYALESDGYAVFRVSLSKAAAGAVVASLATSAINATASADYGTGLEVSADGVTGWAAATSLSFAAGQIQMFVRVAVLADNTTDPQGKPVNIEGNERFSLTATVSAGATQINNAPDSKGVVSATGLGTIVDASVGTTPLAWIDSVTLDEATGQAVFSVARSRSGTAASLTFATADRHELAIDIAASVYAGAGNDTVYASDLGDNILGGAGNDTLYGGRLDDWLLGGDGDDTLNAGSIATGTLGGDGNYLDGGAGNDLLIGREGSDWLEGGDGVDILEGGDGDDVLAGGAGVGDVMHGGRGDDQYIFRLGDVANAAGFDEIRDESGITLTEVVTEAYHGSTSTLADAISGILFRTGKGLNNWHGGGTQVSSTGVAAGGEDALVLGTGITIEDVKISKSTDGKDLIVELWPDGVFSGDRVIMRDWFNSFNKIETLRFADGNEIRLADFDTFILGSDGSDVIVGTSGNDFVHAGSGNDLVYLLAGNDFGNGGLGDDYVSGDSGNDIVVGADGNDIVTGGYGNDSVSGGRGNDRVYGDGGDDIVAGGQGDDEVIGGAGNDVFKFQRGDGKDTMFDALSDEWSTVWVSGTGGVMAGGTGYEIQSDGSLVHKTNGVIDQPPLFDAATGTWSVRTRYDVEQGILYAHLPANPNAIVANSGQDVLEFGIGIDINDLQFQAAVNGRDLVIGIEQSGAYTAGFAGLSDQITLKEWISNPAATGSIETFSFFNTGAVNLTNTALKGGTDGNDTLTGGTGKNWITGGAGDDTITGGALDDILNGNSGQDSLNGGAGNDVLLGGVGNDVLTGGAGADVLVGGDGLDIAAYDTAVTVSLANSALNTGDAVGDTFDGIEGLRGSSAADNLFGDSAENDLRGGQGDDKLRGAGGDDTYTITRGDGNDKIYDLAANGEVVVVDDAGNLQPPYVATVQLVDREGTNNQFEQIITNTESGKVVYRKEYNRAVGLGLYDQPEPTSFDPTGWVAGYVPAASPSQKVSLPIAAPGGSDTVFFEDSTPAGAAPTADLTIGLSDLSFQMVGNDLQITLNTATAGTTIAGGQILIQSFRNGAAMDANSGVETLQFSDGTSVNLAGLKFDASGALLAASSDTSAVPVDDFIVSNASTLSGGYGDDTLLGGAGANILQGGDGDDQLVGGLGADTNQGGLGVDTVSYVGSDGTTANRAIGVTVDLVAGTGSGTGTEAEGDTYTSIENVLGSQFNDVITGNDSDNVLKGNRGDDILTGGGGTVDTTTYGVGADVLIGDGGNDTLAGGVGDDNLDGGDGNDLLTGGGDRDILSGGDGNDILVGDNNAGTAVGGNLLANAGFEDSGDAANDVTTGYGLTSTDLPGWASTSANPVQLLTSASGVTGLTGARALHLDNGAANMVSQTVTGLTAGETLTLNFSHALRAAAATGGVEVLWNGVVVKTVTGGTTALTGAGAITVTAIGGSNVLAFRALGTIDSQGSVIDNITLSRLTGAADQLIGGAGQDRLDGGAGNDVLLGGDGDDNSTFTVTAGAGGTTGVAGLYGGAGDDVLDGGAGNDTLDGGVGNDSYLFRAGSGNDTVVTGGGQDDLIFDKIASGQMWLRQSGSDLEITAIGLGTSVLVKNWFAGSANQARRIVAADKVLARNDVQALVTAMAAVSATVPGAWPVSPTQAFTDALAAAWQLPASYIDRTIYTGTTGDDVITADPLFAGGAKIYSLAGNDVLTGSASDDEFHVGLDSGFDTIIGGAGTDTIIADVDNATIGLNSTAAAPLSGIEKISGNGKAGVVINLGANATIDLTSVAVDGISQINGSSGIDSIIGSTANDTIVGAGGNDILKGGLGDDVLRGGAGNDDLDGGDGSDTYDASDIATAGIITISATGSTQHVAGTETDTLVNFENVIGGSGGNIINGSTVANNLYGGAGNDTISGNDGDDLLSGGAGSDILKGGNGIDTVSYASTVTAVTGITDPTSGYPINGVVVDLKANSSANGITAPTVTASQGDAAGDWFYQIENVVGTQFNDMLTGDDGANFLNGGSGKDALYGGAGDDILLGDWGNDYLDGGTGTNTAMFTGKFADYTIVTGTVTTVTGTGAQALDRTDTLRNIQILKFADVTISLGVNTNNPPILGEPTMVDQAVNDGIAYSYQIPATSFIDLDISGNGNTVDQMVLSATLADGSALPSWLSFNAATRTFSGTVPLAAVGIVYDVKVTATDSGASVSDNFLLTIGQASGADIVGTAAADTLSGTFRAETMIGNAGNDVFAGSDGADRIDGGSETDLVDYGASPLAVSVNLSTGIGTGGYADGDQLISIEKLRGSAFADSLTGSIGQDDLRGGNGDDIIDGGAESDLIEGGAGADTLIGGAGTDTIYGLTKADGSLEDSIDGGEGVDELRLAGDTTLGITGSAYGATVDLSLQSSSLVSIENVVGTDFADRITGNGFSNILKGGLGDDSLSGGDGNDSLEGGAGNDTLVGGAGADRLDGGTGTDLANYQRLTDLGALTPNGVTVDLTDQVNNTGIAAGDILISIENVTGTDQADSLRGDAGANTLSGKAGNDIIRGEGGNDTLLGDDGNDSLTGGAGNDFVDGGLGTDTIVFAGQRSAYTIDLFNRTITHNGGGVDGVDTYQNVEFAQFADQTVNLLAPVTGTPGVTSQSLADNASFTYTIPTTAFNDPDGSQVDPYKGLTFTATLVGGAALPSWLVFNPSTKTFSYSALAAPIGSAASVRVTASDGQASVFADLSFTVSQGAGAPIVGTGGNDILSATFRAETIDGAAGTDRVSYTTSNAAVTVNLATGTVSGGFAQGDTLANIEDITGSDYADTLTGSTIANTIEGGAGADLIYGGAGNDWVSGGAGNDTLMGEDNDDQLVGGAGADILDGGLGIDTANYYYLDRNAPTATLDGAGVTVDLATPANNTGVAAGDTFVSIENLTGTQVADVLRGDGNANVLNGMEGDDTLDGAAGADTLYGGAGNDTLTGGLGADIINGEDGNDTIVATVVGEDTIDGGLGVDTVSFATAVAGQTADLMNAAHKLTNIENVDGSGFDDTITGSALANRIDGGAGNDTIEGKAGADVLIGGSGTDTLSYASSSLGSTFQTAAIGASAVNGVTIAAAAVRTLNGVNVDIGGNSATGADATGDTISGFENLTGSAYADLLRGTATNSLVDGGAGDDVVYGGAGNDTLKGGDGNDFVFGGDGADQLYGDNGDDRLFGDGASDQLFGGAGNDLLDAGDAGDYLDGGTGSDIMIGGNGADHYVIQRDAGTDTIYNYDDDSALDSVSYDQVEYTELWFTKSGKDLQVKILGTTTVTTIKDWFVTTTGGNWDAADNFLVDVFVSGNRVTQQVNLAGLLDVMSVTAEPASYAALDSAAKAKIATAWGTNHEPTIVQVAGNATTVNEDGSINLQFTVADVETAPAGISVLVTTDGKLQAVVPASDVRSIDATTREVTVRPQASFGTGNVRIRAYDGGVYSNELVVPITVIPAAVGLTLSAATSNFTVDAGQPVALTGLSAVVIDIDEAIDYLYLDGLAIGTVLSSGGNSYTATTNNASANITGWNLSTLQLTAASGSSADMTLHLRGRSRDGAPGSYVYSTDTLGTNLIVVVNGAPATPTIVLDGVSSVSENAAPVRIATLTRTDPDGTTPSLRPAGADAAYFQILNGNEVWTVANLDYETKPSINVSVEAYDGALPSVAWTRTITVTNVNETPYAPTQAVAGTTTVAENAAAVRVITLTRSDPDGTTPTLVLQGADAASFQILNGNEIWTIANLNYEAKSSLNLSVAAYDGSLTGAAWTTAVAVTNVNEAPTAITVSPVPFDENVVSTSIAPVQVANLSATDPDASQTLTYSIVGGAQAAKFTISGAGLYLANGQSLDFEAGPALVDIKVTDLGGLSYTRTGVQITATNVNESPSLPVDVNTAGGSGAAGVVGSVADGAGPGTLVGITLSASDPEGGTVSYFLGSNPNGWFDVNHTTGVVFLVGTIQYEDVAITNGQISLNVIARDSANNSTPNNSLLINVTDVNEAPIFTSANSASISETDVGGALDVRLVATIVTSDPDKDGEAFGEAGHTLSISSGDTNTFYVAPTGTAGQFYLYVKSGVALDYDNPANRSYALQFHVTDNNGAAGSLDAYQNFTVNIAPVNEKPSAPSPFSANVNENTFGNLLTVGGSVDPEGDAISYYFAAGGNPGGLFTITTAGVLSLNGALDYENRPAEFALGYADVSVVATTTVNGVPASSVMRTGRITLVNVNEQPTNPAQPAAGSIVENAIGYTGITFSGSTDPDGDAVTYRFANGTTTSGNFSIVNGNQLNVATPFDREVQSTASIAVQAYANGQYSANSVTATISIGGVDDNLPAGTGFTMLNGYTTTIAENSGTPGTTVIAQANAADADGDAITWSIVGGNPTNALGINGSGQLYINAGFNYEALGGAANLGVDPNISFSITVRAAQSGNAGRYVDQTLSLSIADIDETVIIVDNNGAVSYGFGRTVSLSGFGDNKDEHYTIYIDADHSNGYNTGDTIVSSYNILHAGGTNITNAPGYVWNGTPFENGSTFYQALPPIVLDLDSSGIGKHGTTVYFDIDGDGTKDRTGWISGGQGFLVLDRNRDGRIDTGAELSFVNDLPGAATDLEGLRAYDSNNDNVFDARDDRFGEFQVWQDRNENGISEAGELKTLAEAGISSISLAITKTSPGDEDSVLTLGTSVFTRTDGTTSAVGDVALTWGQAAANTALPAQPLPPGTTLASDQDGNGSIDTASEVYTLAQALHQFDSNGDARITPADANYTDLRLWTDANHNGRAESIELASLADAGLTSLGVVSGPPGSDTSLPALTVGHQTFSEKSKKYQLTTLNGQMYVRYRKGGTVDDRAGLIGPATTLQFKNESFGVLSPFILDLDGNGVQTRQIKKSHARFDMNGDGTSDDTGWVGKGDGFLVIDRNGDGLITSASELTFLSDKANATSGFDSLSALDSNKDGKIDSRDTRFGELRIWVDADDDGVTDAGELKTLADHGIASIDLSAHAVNQDLVIGWNAVVATSTFTRTDGSVGTVGSMAMGYRPAATSSTNPKNVLMADVLARLRERSESGALDNSRALLSAASLLASEDIATVPAAQNQSPAILSPDALPIEPLQSSLVAQALDARLAALREGLAGSLFDDPMARMPVASLAANDDDAGTQKTQDLPEMRLPDPAGEMPDMRPMLMAQTMAAFGAKMGEGEWKGRSGLEAARFDYFAS